MAIVLAANRMRVATATSNTDDGDRAAIESTV